MTDPHDDIDTWLHAEVEPLRPPPGTFEQIRKQARRRRARRAVLSAGSAGAAAVVIVLAVVALPHVVPSVLHLKPNPAGNNSTATIRARSSAPPATSPSPTAAATTPSSPVSSQAPAVPANFAATSVTFIGLQTGWVIGQAGPPGHCYTRYCTSVARTDDAGTTWHGVHAPITGPPDGGSGVSQIRFLNQQDGWAFGPALWATHDGGRSWEHVPLGGLRVLSLETVGSEAFAVLGRCTGTGIDFAAGCTRFALYSSPMGSDDWAQVPGVARVTAVGPSAGSASLALTQDQGYWYTPQGMLLSGPVSGTAPWTAVSASALPCLPGAAQPDGRPAGGQLAASAPGDLVLACPAASPTVPGSQLVTTYVSSDGGATWTQQGQAAIAGTVTSVAAGTGGEVVLGCTAGIYSSPDNGATWTQAQAGPPGGFSYVGLTSASQGVAVPADPGQDAVWFTIDGGRAWRHSGVRNR